VNDSHAKQFHGGSIAVDANCPVVLGHLLQFAEVLGDRMGHPQTNVNPKLIVQKVKAANRPSREVAVEINKLHAPILGRVHRDAAGY
jgi:hypothetical protein